MSGLLAALQMAGGALAAYSRALEVTQNNLVNASTPGYARQSVVLQAQPFQPWRGLLGGMQLVALQNSRSEFAESSVRVQTSALERDRQLMSLLGPILPLFDTQDVSTATGLAGEFRDWFSAVRAWDASPYDSSARQNVMNHAATLAASFRDTAEALRTGQQDALQQLRLDVDQVNGILADLERMQKDLRGAEQPDPGTEASFYAKLEELSQYMDVRVSRAANGQTTVTTASGAVLLTGERAWPLSVSLEPPPADAAFPTAPPTIKLLAGDGSDVSASVTGGRIGALLYGLTEIFPSLLGDATQQGDLNRLAEAFGKRVNEILTSGLISDTPPVAGIPLFAWDTADPLAIARTFAVAPGIDASKLALIRTQPTVDPHGIPAQLLGLVSGADPADGMQPEEKSFTNFLRDLGLQLSALQSSTQKAETFHMQFLAQAQGVRERISGVSLEEESVALLQFQRSFQAMAKLISVLDGLTETTLNMIR